MADNTESVIMTDPKLAKDVEKMRATVAEAIAGEEALDASRIKPSDLADCYVALAERTRKLRSQLARERANREDAIAEATAELTREADEAQTRFIELNAAADAAAEVGRRSLQSAALKIEDIDSDLAAVRAHLAESLRRLHDVTQLLLDRPHRILEIYGEQGHQAVVDAFLYAGGDPTSVISPVVAEFREKTEAESSRAAGDE